MKREMKHSGVAWIGEIPKHWEVVQVKKYCKNIYAGGTPDSNNMDYWEEGNIPWLPSGMCRDSEIYEANKFITQLGFENSSTKIIPAYTTIMAMTGATCGNMGFVTFETCANQSVVAYVSENNSFPKYLFYALLSAREYILTFQTGGAQAGINVQNCKNFIIPFIDIEEQQKIAEFLDRKCGEIDEMISLQEKVIEELKAYKQSIITETVTKGLNPNVAMRDSEIEWIGEMPEHWEVKRLKYLCHIQTGNKDTQDADDNGEYLFYVRSPFIERSISYSFEGEGILIAGDGVGAGRVFHHAFGKYAVHQRVYRLSDIININSYYLFYYISSLFNKIMDMGSAQSTVPSVRLPMLTNFIVCNPSLSEQQQIADYLDRKCAKIDELVAVKQQKIETLKEYKKSLIYEYVTGKKEIECFSI